MGRNHFGNTTGKTFRISVCLKRFFSDERARCYIKADAGLRFRWLAARMRRLFGLTGPFCLVSRGHLLPPDEPVGLLSPNDLVEVIPKHYKMFPDTSESDESEIIEDLFKSDDEIPGSSYPVAHIPAKQATKEDLNNHEKTSHVTVNHQSSNSTIPEQNPTESKALQEVTVDDLQNVQNQNYNNTDVTDGKLEAENENLKGLDDLQNVQNKNYNYTADVTDGKLEAENENLKAFDALQNVQNKNYNNTDVTDEKLEAENENLEALKRKALEMLDQCSIPVKRKRKRVRRRKRCTANQELEDTEDVNDGPEPPTSDTGTSISPAATEHAADDNDVPERSLSPQHRETLILRNNVEHSRTARIVHSLL